MLISADLLRLHLDYSRWASARLLDAVATLPESDLRRDFGTAHKSIIGTLAHVYRGDRIWLARVLGDDPQTLPEAAGEDLAALGPAMSAASDGWLDWVQALSDEDVMRALRYSDMKGNTWTTPLYQIVLHVVNHGTHHRGQAAGFLRALGQAPPPLDLIAYYRQLGSAAAG